MDFTKIKPNVKKVLRNNIAPLNDFAILLSSGVDSRSIFFESIIQKKRFTCYTFHLKGVQSIDLLESIALCNSYKIQHISIELPNSIEVLINDLKTLKKLGAKKKTDFECFWPFLYVYKVITEHTILSGMGADGHFGISKKAMIHFRDKLDEYRDSLFGNPAYCQRPLHAQYDVIHIMPFLTEAMINEFKGTSWDSINKPKQKMAIRTPYISYFNKIKVYNHQNFQLGDSGISEHFKKLLQTYLNTGNFKSVVSIFNRITVYESIVQRGLFPL